MGAGGEVQGEGDMDTYGLIPGRVFLILVIVLLSLFGYSLFF